MRRWRMTNFSRIALVPTLVLVGLGASGCSASFCAGSGCDSGKIYFGTGYSQSGSGGSLSITGKKSTFKLGTGFTMVANLSENAKTHTLTLRVDGPKGHKSLPYHVRDTSSNELGTKFVPSDLQVLGMTSAGTYTVSLLRGTKQLATGSLTEQ